MNKKLLSLLALSATSLWPLQAEMLVSWDPEGFIYKGADKIKPPQPWAESVNSPAGEAISIVTVAPGVKVSEGLDLGPGFKASRLNTAWGGVSSDEHSKTAAEAERAGNFITFSIAPEPGYQLALKSIEMNALVREGVTLGYIWQYSLDGTTFTDITTTPSTIAGNFGRPGGRGQTLDSLNISNIAPLKKLGTAVTFRLVLWKISGETLTEPGGFLFAIGRMPGEDLSVQGEAKKGQ